MKSLKKSSFIAKFGLLEGIKLYYKFKLNKTSEIKLNSLRYPIFMRPNTKDDYSFKEIFFDKDYDIEFPEFDKNEIVIIDGGANIGFASAYFTNKFPASQILALEPESENYTWLQKNTKNYENITTIKGGLWNKDSFLHVKDEGWGIRGFMVEEVEQETKDTIRGCSIKTLMEKYNIESIDIFKIDIEGSEKELFEKNYEFWLPKTKCIIIETHDRMKEGCSKAVFNTIEKYDFDKFESGENVILINKQL